MSLTGYKGGKLKAVSDYNINVDCETIEQIEDFHLIIEHIIVYCYKHRNEK